MDFGDDDGDKIDLKIDMRKSEFENLEDAQKDKFKMVRGGRTTEKRIEEFDLGKMLGNKF